MDREKSKQISEKIAELIITQAPYVDYSPKDVKKALKSFSDEDLKLLRRNGLLYEDFEVYYVMKRFCDELNLSEQADEDYLRTLFQYARKFTVEEFYNNDYIKLLNVPDRKLGQFFLTHASYDRGEFFQYEIPDVNADIPVLKLGFFTGKVSFPTIYEGSMPWVSVCPSETSSMQDGIDKAHGRCLVLGLGLGYYPFMISQKSEVSAVTIVELSPQIIQLFEECILWQMPHKEKIKIIRADALEYIKEVEGGEFDFCYADIWENQFDGADCYEKLLPHEKRLAMTQFEYWIEDAIKLEYHLRLQDDAGNL